MAAPYGGPLPLINQDSRLSVEAPDGTDATTPVNEGDLFKLAVAADTAADSSGYKAIACVAGDDLIDSYIVQALHGISSVNQMGVLWLSGSAGTVQELPYSAEDAPVVGESVEISTVNVRKVVGVTHAKGKGLVLKVDTTRLIAEVLF